MNLILVMQRTLQVYLRGSQIRYFILPDMLRHAPMFKKKALYLFRTDGPNFKRDTIGLSKIRGDPTESPRVELVFDGDMIGFA